ncbi:histidine kinase [Burkholderia thailandensis]|nr:histidine kinase [Burkholderia humptydooensis]ATF35053.1 histidine kinase [Burkholderia thailandensis]KST75627.1 histidine kinase [Burkholderia humptydooensis]
MRRRVAAARHRQRIGAKIAAQPTFRSAMSAAFHSRSLSPSAALAAHARMAGLNLKKRLSD